MGELLLCHETIAALPYFIEETGINIYSMEELSYYISGNVYLLDHSFMCESLCTWVEKQMHRVELAQKLRENIRTEGKLSDCFCHIAGYGILYHERNAGDRFCGPANGTEVGF